MDREDTGLTAEELERARAVLAAASEGQWAVLAERVAALEPLRAGDHGQWRGGPETSPGVRRLPFAVLGAEATAALEAAEAIGVPAPQRWMDWDEGRRIAGDPRLVDAAEPAVCALLVGTLRRNERFHEGVLLSAFDSGLMLALLRGMLRASPGAS